MKVAGKEGERELGEQKRGRQKMEEVRVLYFGSSGWCGPPLVLWGTFLNIHHLHLLSWPLAAAVNEGGKKRGGGTGGKGGAQ